MFIYLRNWGETTAERLYMQHQQEDCRKFPDNPGTKSTKRKNNRIE